MFAMGVLVTLVGFLALVLMYVSADRKRKLTPPEKPATTKSLKEIIVRSTGDVTATDEDSNLSAPPESTCFYNPCECFQARYSQFQISLSSKVQSTS